MLLVYDIFHFTKFMMRWILSSVVKSSEQKYFSDVDVTVASMRESYPWFCYSFMDLWLEEETRGNIIDWFPMTKSLVFRYMN